MTIPLRRMSVVGWIAPSAGASSEKEEEGLSLVTPIIDTDTHFTEPPDLWTSRLPRRFGDQILRSVWDEKSRSEVWVTGDRVLGGVWGFLAYGRSKAMDSRPPATRDEAHVATWDQAERVKLMDEHGIRAAVLYPNIAGLQPSNFLAMSNTEIANAHVSAYNDYQVEWSANYPGRFVPMLVIPFWDVDAAVEEIERTAGEGFGGVVTTAAPHYHGCPFLADHAHWDRLWSACVAHQLSVSFHIANGDISRFFESDFRAFRQPGTHIAYTAVPNMLFNGVMLLDLLLSGVLVRHPALKFVSVESGMGWVPFVLEAADYHFVKGRDPGVHPWGDLLPSDLCHRQVMFNTWFEDIRSWHLEAIGEDNILFETDFPHPTCLEGKEIEEAVTVRMAGISASAREKILWRNAAGLYNIDVASSTPSSVGHSTGPMLNPSKQ